MFFWCVPVNAGTHHDIRPLNISTLLRFAESSSGYWFFGVYMYIYIYVYIYIHTYMLWLWLGIPNNSQDFVFKSVYPNHNFEYDVATLHLHRWPKGSNKFWVPADRGKLPDPRTFPISGGKKTEDSPCFFGLKCPWNGKFFYHITCQPIFSTKLIYSEIPRISWFTRCKHNFLVVNWCLGANARKLSLTLLWLVQTQASLKRVLIGFPDGKSNATYSTCTYASWSLGFFTTSSNQFATSPTNWSLQTTSLLYISEFCQL